MDDQMQLMCFNDPQALLAESFKIKNLDRFKQALELGANPNIVDREIHLSIFEKCCQTPNYGNFIKECIDYGCDVNQINEHYEKRPINFGVESEDSENLKVLIDEPTLQLDSKYDDLTPIHVLATNLNDNNFKNVFECIQLLIESNANLNIPNKRQITPILTIAKKKLSNERKEMVIKYILEHCTNIDLDTFRDGEARIYLQKHFPNFVLPQYDSQKDDNWDFIKLITALRNGKEDQFLFGLNNYLNQQTQNEDNRKNLFRENDGEDTLLIVTAKQGLFKASKKLLRSGADVNYKPARSSSSPLKFACSYGNWEILDLFLKCSNLYVNDEDLLLSSVIKNIGDEPHKRSCDYSKCFNLLINCADIDVNQTDKYGTSALHYAVRYNNKIAIKALLNKGAYIGAKNKFSDYSITDIDPKILEDHFNSCITTNSLRPGDDSYEIIFKYTNLVPICARKVQAIDPKDINSSATPKESSAHTQCADEMAPIEYMANCNELKHLIKHPIIASFLFLKWHRLSLIFYTNFMAYAIYSLAMIFYILFCYGQDSSKELSTILLLITAIGGLYVFVREIAQLIMSPKHYLTSKENYLEIALIVMTFLILCNKEYEDSVKRTIAAFTILLAIAEFFLLTGSLPILSFSTHLVMLKTVTKSFLRSLALYSMILIGFAICFYVLLGESQQQNAISNNNNNNNNVKTNGDVGGDVAAEDDDEFNKFIHPGISIIKTVVMLTGEFDAASINFKQNVSSYVMFLIFIFLISSVLVNLLNGLAVSDIQAIKNEAELMNFIHRAELMSRYERIMTGKGESQCCNFILRKWTSSVLSLFPKYLPKSSIIILPNLKNQIKVPTINDDEEILNSKGLRKMEENVDSINLQCSLNPLICFGHRCSQMESKIVKYAKAVLEYKEKEIQECEDKEESKQRLITIENRLDNITLKLDTLIQEMYVSTKKC